MLPGLDVGVVGIEAVGAGAEAVVAGPVRLRRPDRQQALVQTG